MDVLYVYWFKSVDSYKHKLSRIESLVILYWRINCTEGSQVIISKEKNTFLSLKIVFILANSEGPDEMLHCAAFHLGPSQFAIICI